MTERAEEDGADADDEDNSEEIVPKLPYINEVNWQRLTLMKIICAIELTEATHHRWRKMDEHRG